MHLRPQGRVWCGSENIGQKVKREKGVEKKMLHRPTLWPALSVVYVDKAVYNVFNEIIPIGWMANEVEKLTTNGCNRKQKHDNCARVKWCDVFVLPVLIAAWQVTWRVLSLDVLDVMRFVLRGVYSVYGSRNVVQCDLKRMMLLDDGAFGEWVRIKHCARLCQIVSSHLPHLIFSLAFPTGYG